MRAEELEPRSREDWKWTFKDKNQKQRKERQREVLPVILVHLSIAIFLKRRCQSIAGSELVSFACYLQNSAIFMPFCCNLYRKQDRAVQL